MRETLVPTVRAVVAASGPLALRAPVEDWDHLAFPVALMGRQEPSVVQVPAARLRAAAVIRLGWPNLQVSSTSILSGTQELSTLAGYLEHLASRAALLRSQDASVARALELGFRAAREYARRGKFHLFDLLHGFAEARAAIAAKRRADPAVVDAVVELLDEARHAVWHAVAGLAPPPWCGGVPVECVPPWPPLFRWAPAPAKRRVRARAQLSPLGFLGAALDPRAAFRLLVELLGGRALEAVREAARALLLCRRALEAARAPLLRRRALQVASILAVVAEAQARLRVAIGASARGPSVQASEYRPPGLVRVLARILVSAPAAPPARFGRLGGYTEAPAARAA